MTVIDNIFNLSLSKPSEFIYIIQDSNVTTNSTSLIDITNFTVSMLANSTYEIEVVMTVGSSEATNGVKYAVHFTTSGATNVNMCTYGQVGSASMKTEQLVWDVACTAMAKSSVIGGVIIKGLVKVGANAGIFSIQHEKVTSGTSTIYSGSYLKYRKIA